MRSRRKARSASAVAADSQVQPGGDRSKHTRRVDGLGRRIGDVGQQDRAGNLDRRVVDPVAQPTADPSGGQADCSPGRRRVHDRACGARSREVPGGGGGHGSGIQYQRCRIVEQRLPFQDSDQPPRQAEPPGDAGSRRRVRRTDRSAEHERHRPGQVTDPVGDRSHHESGRHHQQNGKHPDRAGMTENAVGDDVTAASNTSRGSRPSNTTSGWRETSGTNGRNPIIRPATTSTTGAGTPVRRSTATANRVNAATPRTTSSWPELTIRYLPLDAPAANSRGPLPQRQHRW